MEDLELALGTLRDFEVEVSGYTVTGELVDGEMDGYACQDLQISVDGEYLTTLLCDDVGLADTTAMAIDIIRQTIAA